MSNCQGNVITSLQCLYKRILVSVTDIGPKKGTPVCHGETTETQMGVKKGDVESGLVYCTLLKLVPS